MFLSQKTPDIFSGVVRFFFNAFVEFLCNYGIQYKYLVVG
jgi:hypothetical protein